MSHSASCQSSETKQEDLFFQLTELQETEDKRSHRVKIFRWFKMARTQILVMSHFNFPNCFQLSDLTYFPLSYLAMQ